MKNKMDYREFLSEVKQQVQENIEDKYEVEIYKVPKNNGIIQDGLSIRLKTDSCAHAIYLNAYYEQLGNDMTLEEIVADIVSVYKTHIGISANQEEALICFDHIKDNVVFKLIRVETNLELLMDIPHVRFLDMAVVFYLILAENETGQMTALICNSHLEVWGITEEELYRQAKINTPKLLPARIQTMKAVISEMFATQLEEDADAEMMDELLEDITNEPPLYVFTNKNGINGAGCILYDGPLEEFAQEQNADIIILPASLHEVLLTPDFGDMEYKDMEEMVKLINQTEVAEEDVLSDRIYRYSINTKEITIVE